MSDWIHTRNNPALAELDPTEVQQLLEAARYRTFVERRSNNGRWVLWSVLGHLALFLVFGIAPIWALDMELLSWTWLLSLVLLVGSVTGYAQWLTARQLAPAIRELLEARAASV